MDNSAVTITTLAIAYAPALIAVCAGVGGGGVWKFLAFALSTFALLGAVFIVPGLIAWLLAFACAAAAHSAARKVKASAAILAELHEQNRILRGEPPPAPAKGHLEHWRRGEW
jgi:hypothetical protein